MQLANICPHTSLHLVCVLFHASNKEHSKCSLCHFSIALVHHSTLISFGLQPLVLFGSVLKHLAVGHEAIS